MPDGVLARFYQVLVEEIRSQRPDYLTGPFTVAEIYQRLVPYGSHRDRIGVDMNGDYEEALLRLLAGEGEYLVLESEAALGVLQSEIASGNPNTSLYREFAALDVRLNPGRSGDNAEEQVPASRLAPEEDDDREGGEPSGTGSLFGRAQTGDPEGLDLFPLHETTDQQAVAAEGVEEPSLESEGTSVADTSAFGVRPGGHDQSCSGCGAALPTGFVPNFCPMCGMDQTRVSCTACGSMLEPEWRFCASCGSGPR